jgi:hypothetical protein
MTGGELVKVVDRFRRKGNSALDEGVAFDVAGADSEVERDAATVQSVRKNGVSACLMSQGPTHRLTGLICGIERRVIRRVSLY